MDLGEAMTAAPTLDVCQLRRGTNTGAWLTMLPSTVNGKELGDQEWGNSLFICYIIEPPDLPSHCYGYNSKFSIFDSLDFNNGGLITNHHNESVMGSLTFSTGYRL